MCLFKLQTHIHQTVTPGVSSTSYGPLDSLIMYFHYYTALVFLSIICHDGNYKFEDADGICHHGTRGKKLH